MLDLIDECGHDLASCGYETIALSPFNMTASKLFVDSRQKANDLGFDMGHYFILNAPKLNLLMREHRDFLLAEVKVRLKFLFKTNKIKKKDRILFVGIGNPLLPADSFGPLVVNKIKIEPFKKNNNFFKLSPNTFTNTGFNAYDIIKIVVETYDISAVVLFDSLATNNIGRLGTSVQFNDAGLTPGSAMNNFGLPINRETLHVPCLAVGVPMMISSLAFGQKKEIVFTEKDVIEKVEFLSSLIADVINEIF
ncbi:MAG: GPR endopeptidase [Candidatus Caccovivens sp.]